MIQFAVFVSLLSGVAQLPAALPAADAALPEGQAG